MVHTPCLGKDKSVIYTGMFLRPQCAESLKQLISHKLVQERALFAVAKTQVHLNGLCEIVVRKLDTTVSTSSIMELLKQCYDIVQSRSPDCEGKGDKLNRTIDLTCDDNNSPRPLTERKITFQRHPFISSSSSGESDLNFPSVQSFPSSSQVKSIFEQEANSHYVSLSPQKTETSRKVSFKRKITDSIEPVKLSKQSPNEFSLKPVEGRPNIVVQLSNEGKTLITEKIDDPKKSVSPQVFEDPLPSAPTWTSTEPSKFPLSNVSRLLGAKLLPSSSTSDSEHAEQAVDQLSISKISEEAPKISSASASKIMSGSEISNSILDESLEILEMCKSQGSANSDVSASEVLTKGKINGNGGKNRLEVNLLGALNKKEEKEQTYNATIDQQRGTNSKKSQVQISNLKNRSDVNDDDIIIEKELKSDRTSLQHALIIDDSDDDIAVCEVVPSKISAGTNFVASTSSGFAPDFIPLTPFHRRINPKVSNSLSQRHVIMKKKCTNKEKGKLKRNMKLHLQSNCTKEEASGAVDKKPKRVTNKEKNGLRVNPIGTNTCESKKHDFDGNIMNPNSGEPKLGLRPVVIDASNVAVGHGRGSFSVAGLKICIKYFLDRGHKVHAIAPKFRRFRVSPEERKTLDELENDGVLSFTPSRTMPDGRKVASYDDRFIVQTAAELGGVVVSTDNFRDLLSENETWRETIEQRLLMFTWVGDMLLFPNDPLGRNGPHLQEFLRFPDSPPKDK